jgi:hypothetical protein
MRGGDHWRVVGILPPPLRERDGVDFDDVLPSLRGETGLEVSFQACSWFSTYRIHHRSASRFRAGRCFLLGDAAHIHSPVGAQGMNTGLQDAYNLAWKLSLVVKHQAAESLLDSYEDERLPIAKRLLDTTDRAFRLVVSDHWLAGLLRTRVLARIAALAMRRKRMQNFAFRTVSQIGIHYRDSGLSESIGGTPRRSPQAGDRFPWLRLNLRADGPVEDLFQALDDTHFHLLVFGQPAPADEALGMDDLLRIHAIPETPHNEEERERATIPRQSFFLLRPDGHVGLRGTRVDAAAVRSYAESRLRMTKPPA